MLFAVGCARDIGAAAGDGLIADITGIYDLRPDEPAANVSWQVELENAGGSYVGDVADLLSGGAYTGGADDSIREVAVLVPGGRPSFAARGEAGERLPVAFYDIEDGFAYAVITLGRALDVGDTYSLNYEYRLTADDSGPYSLLRNHYVSLVASPGILADTFRSNILRVAVPGSYRDDVLVQGADCTSGAVGGSAVFDCVAEDEYGIYATVEVVDPSARVVTSEPVSAGEVQVNLILRYLSGDEEWARHVKDMVIQGLPALQEVTGVPYSGPPAIRVSEKGLQELGGAEGRAACDMEMCATGITPDAGDQTILHELAHFWTQQYNKSSLAEGAAEFYSLKAAGILDIETYDPRRGGRPPFPLDEWGRPFNRLTASDEELAHESQGYTWSTAFFAELEARNGLEALKPANAQLVQLAGDTVDSRRFMDILEDTSGVKADGLFGSHIFSEADRPLITARRTARDAYARLSSLQATGAAELPANPLTPVHEDILAWKFGEAQDALDSLEPGLEAYIELKARLDKLRTDAEAAGLVYPLELKNAERSWDFAPYLELIEDAEAAVVAYAEASAIVAPSPGLWERMGLLWRDPEKKLAGAATAFAGSRFAESAGMSRDAASMVHGASTRAIRNSAVGAVLAGAFLVGAYYAMRWALREDARAAGSST